VSDGTDWWEGYFRGAWGRVQAAGYPEERTRSEVDFAIEALGLAGGERVLDVPCGEGRHSIELAARGFAVTGVDFNPGALEAARARAKERKVTAQFLEADMREPQTAGSFDAVLCFFGSFGYFSDAENLRCARAFASALREGGRLLIDTQVAESLLPRYAERDWIWSGTPGSSLRIMQERSFDHETGRILASWALVDPDGGIETARSSIRLYTYRELCELLRAAGFTGAMTGVETLTGQPFGVGAKRLSLVATK
jgi:SAM-dependent methyltransferase